MHSSLNSLINLQLTKELPIKIDIPFLLPVCYDFPVSLRRGDDCQLERSPNTRLVEAREPPVAIVGLQVRIDVDVAIFGIHRPMQPRAVVNIAIGELDRDRVYRLRVQQLDIIRDIYPMLPERHLGQWYLSAVDVHLVDFLTMKVEEEVCTQSLPGHLFGGFGATLANDAQVELNLYSSHEKGGVFSLIADIQ